MPGGGKSSPSGVTTTTSINPTQQAQLPFLQSGWESAQNLYQNSPYGYYPGTTLASPNYWLPTGYNELAGAGANANAMLPMGMNLFSDIAGGGNSIYNSPAFSGLADIASGTNAYLQQSAGLIGNLGMVGDAASTNPYAAQLAQLAAMAQVPNYGMNSLQNTASGMYLNSNPYLDDMFGSASDAVTRAYQNATAPQTASNFSGAGRYGSGAYANSVSQNQQDLATQLGNLSANIYGGNYQAERARQDAASQALATLIAQNYGLQGNFLNAAGNQYLQGLSQASRDYATAAGLDLANLGAQQNALNSLQSGYQAGNQNELQALQLFPSLLQSMFSPSQAMIQAGQGLTGLEQQSIQDQMNRFYGTQQAPWTNLTQYMNAIGQPTTGSGSTTSPYFTNPTANLLSTGLGGLSLYNGLSNAGLFGSAVPAGWAAGSGAGSGIFTNLASGVTSDIAGSGFPGLGIMSGLGGLFGKFSDRRLKDDVEVIGVLPNGLSVYSFRYLWDDEPEIGLMADEVEAIHPEAVIDGPFGFKAVDYARAVQ